MTALSPEQLEQYLIELEDHAIEQREWLVSRGWKADDIKAYRELERAVDEEYHKLAEEVGWYSITSISVVNARPAYKKGTNIKTVGIRFYRNSTRKESRPYARWYDPHKKCFHGYGGIYYPRYNVEYSREDLKFVEANITQQLEDNNVVVEPNDILVFSVWGSDTDPNIPEFHYKYVDKMN